MFFGGLGNSAAYAIVGELNVAYLMNKIKKSLILGIYISETCHKSMRNRLATIQGQSISLGIFQGYAIGYLFGWRNQCIVLSLLATLAAFLPLMTFETPYWLCLEGKRAEAE